MASDVAIRRLTVKSKRRRQRGYRFTARDDRTFRQVAEVLEGAWGAGPQRYMYGYLRIWARYHRLKQAGINVTISSPALGCRGPFLIIAKRRGVSHEPKNLSAATRYQRPTARHLRLAKSETRR